MVGGIIGLVLMITFFVLCAHKDIWSKFDHSGWNKNANPDPNATIIYMNSEEVKYAKNDAKFKTTIIFSDGFYFITHKTNREDGFFKYQISVDKELAAEIIAKAMRRHQKAIEKIKQKEKN